MLNKILNFLKNNKKIVIIVGVVLVVIIAAFIIFNNVTGAGMRKDLKKYLESIGYNCNGKATKDGIPVDGYIYCNITDPNGVFREVNISKTTKNVGGISYTETVYGTYKIHIPGSKYITKGTASYEDLIEDKRFNFSDKFSVGYVATCDSSLSKNSKEICEDDVKDFNLALRYFESILTASGVKMN